MESKLLTFFYSVLCLILSSLLLTTCAKQDVRQDSLKVVCYLGSWANYRQGDGKFVIEDINPYLCTHLVYAFAKLDGNVIAPYDTYLDLSVNYGLGGYRRFNTMKRINPNLKTMIAIGGWNEGSVKYSQMARNPASRKTFVKSCVDFLVKYKFDGLDVDWEYPASRGGISEDKANYVQLLKELKEAFRPHGFLLSAAVSAGINTINAAYDIPAISKYLDFINLMAYDFHGGWNSETGHNSPLYAHAEGQAADSKLFTVDFAVKYWLESGAPRDKLVLGMPLYGRSFALHDPQKNSVGAPATKGMAGKYTGEAGMLGYNEICEMFGTQKGWTLIFDKAHLVPFAYKNRDWITYDDVKSISIKVDYIKKMQLGGGMVWSIETDDFHGKCMGIEYPLLQTINKELGRDIPPQVLKTTSKPIGSTERKSSPEYLKPSKSPTANTQEPSGPCKTAGYHRNPEDCKKFFLCVPKDKGDFFYYPFDCAPGTVFSEKINTCTFPDQVPECKM